MVEPYAMFTESSRHAEASMDALTRKPVYRQGAAPGDLPVSASKSRQIGPINRLTLLTNPASVSMQQSRPDGGSKDALPEDTRVNLPQDTRFHPFLMFTVA